MARAALPSIRSPDRGGKAILTVTARAARLAAFALEIRGFEEDFVQETGVHNGAFGADKFGLKKLKGVHWNLEAPQLYEYSIGAGEARGQTDSKGAAKLLLGQMK